MEPNYRVTIHAYGTAVTGTEAFADYAAAWETAAALRAAGFDARIVEDTFTDESARFVLGGPAGQPLASNDPGVTPRWRTDCSHCVFVGRVGPIGEQDAWYCDADPLSTPSLILRDSDRPGDYESANLGTLLGHARDLGGARYLLVLLKAYAAGLVSDAEVM